MSKSLLQVVYECDDCLQYMQNEQYCPMLGRYTDPYTLPDDCPSLNKEA